ncbi:MAG: beta-glucosidase [Bacilli bacterium]
MKNNDIIKKLTLEEKCLLLEGIDNWHTLEIKDILPSVMMTDGPNGVRKEIPNTVGVNGMVNSVKATCFPTNVSIGATFNKDLAYLEGKTIGEEAKANQVSMILGPGVNIKRNPLCGRNFEYYSEDPFLAGLMGASFINGLQSTGVGACIKHFACNNQETLRNSINAEVDERALREIYLRPFQIAIRESQPRMIMSSYNRVNGVYSSDNKYFINDILRNEWGFKGLVCTDWLGMNDKVTAIKAGNDLEMPTSHGRDAKKLLQAVKDKKITEEEIDLCCDRVISFVLESHKNLSKTTKCDLDKHYEISKSISDESIVLLKNNNVLPLKRKDNVAFIGDFAFINKYQGGGSSHINAYKVTNVIDALKLKGYSNVKVAKGFDSTKKELDSGLLKEARDIAKNVDKLVLFVGLTDLEETEGMDRPNMRLSNMQLKFIDEMCKVNKNIIITLFNGSPIEMPFINNVKGIIEAYCGGEAYGESIVDVLFGNVNPSGRLGETFPIKYEDLPSSHYFPGSDMTSTYKESIYVGYRYFDTFKKPVLFPFGFGLSYTNFSYRDISIKSEDDRFIIKVFVKNIGDVKGKEVVELYVGSPNTSVFKGKRGLRDFTKVELEPNEEKEVTLIVKKEDIRFFNLLTKKWTLENGTYSFLVGPSIDNLEVSLDFLIFNKDETTIYFTKEDLPSYFAGNLDNISDEEFERIYQRKLAPKTYNKNIDLGLNINFYLARKTFFGKIINSIINHNKTLKAAPMLWHSALEETVRQLILMNPDINEKQINSLLKALNGSINPAHLIRASKTLMSILKKVTC